MNPSQLPACFVFNGDADGIISQHLAALAGTVPAQRITGLKRDLSLLHRLTGGEPLDIRVFDINVGSNRAALVRLLANPAISVTWYDHHEPGEIPASSRLRTVISSGRGTCTALLVHTDMPGQDPRWAAMAAFGDNVPESAAALLRPLSLPPAEVDILREAGELINYNAYGETLDDVLFPPLEVARRMEPFSDPSAFVNDSGLIGALRVQFHEDERSMGGLSPVDSRGRATLYTLPGEAWARRLGSTFANRAALADPVRAFAVLHPLQDGSYQVSLRAPRGRPDAAPASVLAREFPSGGGRALAAGINRMPPGDVDAFARRFFDVYG